MAEDQLSRLKLGGDSCRSAAAPFVYCGFSPCRASVSDVTHRLMAYKSVAKPQPKESVDCASVQYSLEKCTISLTEGPVKSGLVSIYWVLNSQCRCVQSMHKDLINYLIKPNKSVCTHRGPG